MTTRTPTERAAVEPRLAIARELEGLETDVRFWRSAVEHAHPGDRAVVVAFVSAEERMLDAIAGCVFAPGGATFD
jgi:16S rRNA C1402 N4-methylase RsmH